MVNQPLRILVVEDDEVDRMIIKRALKSSGINVEVSFAEDHESGKEATLGKNYDCIFLDYNLPGGTGLELLKTIRNQGNTSPIIIVTSHGDEKVAVEAMKSGASDYIPKSLLSPEGLAQSLRYILRFKKAEADKERIEQALRDSEKKLQTVISNSPIIVFALDDKGVFTLFEGKGVESLGADKNRIIGKSMHSFAHMFPQVIEIFERTMKGEEVTAILELGNRFYQAFYSPIRDKENRITGIIGVSSDITDHKLAELELKKAKLIAEETATIKEQFLANMSHEIRTPMNGIIGLTHILLNTKLDEEQRGYMKSIMTSSDNLLVIINDILDFSKIEAGRMNFEKVPFSIAEIARNAVDLFKAKAAEKKLYLNMHIDPQLPRNIAGDPTRLSQILNNLIGNAIKFTNDGGVSMEISIQNKINDQVTLDFKITDTGIGIPEESLHTIFDSFTQACSDTTRKFGGTGLGLTIVKHLVSLQGGTIQVSSKLGEGTTFSFHLSYEIAAGESILPKINDDENDLPLSHLNILVAEDNEINQLIVRKILKDWKANFEVAGNGAIALEKLKEAHFDLILMDIQMPEMDGYTATQKIRKEFAEPLRSIPIIAMTAHAVPTERQKCFDLGMNGYVSKPFHPMKLKKKIIQLTKDLKKNSSAPGMEPFPATNGNIHQHSATNDGNTGFVPGKGIQTNPVKHIKQETMTSNMKNDFASEDGKINLSYLKEIAEGNTEFIIEMIEVFLQKTPEALEQMKACFEKKNWEELRLIAHRIKPSYTYMGLNTTQKVLSEIESLSPSVSDMEKIPMLVSSVEEVSKTAFDELKKELSGLK